MISAFEKPDREVKRGINNKDLNRMVFILHLVNHGEVRVLADEFLQSVLVLGATLSLLPYRFSVEDKYFYLDLQSILPFQKHVLQFLGRCTDS